MFVEFYPGSFKYVFVPIDKFSGPRIEKFCFQVVNHHLLRDLTERGLWNKDVKNAMIAHNGSIQVIFLLLAAILIKKVVLFYYLKNLQPGHRWYTG